MRTYQFSSNQSRTVIVLSRNEARALIEFASKDETLPSLCGIYFRESVSDREDGQRFVEALASDGHSLLTLRAIDPHPAQWVRAVPDARPDHDVGIARSDFTRMAKSLRAKDFLAITITADPEGFEISATIYPSWKSGDPDFLSPGAVFVVRGMSEKMPAFDPVIPQKRKSGDSGAGFFGISPIYLAQLAAVSAAVSQINPASEVSTGGETDPVRFDLVGTEASAIVVIMPMCV